MTTSSSNPPLMSILSDQPARDDQLDFAPYAETLAEIIADPNMETPLTIGVFGGWGQGKTSLMRMVQRRLAGTAESASSARRRPERRPPSFSPGSSGRCLSASPSPRRRRPTAAASPRDSPGTRPIWCRADCGSRYRWSRTSP